MPGFPAMLMQSLLCVGASMLSWSRARGRGSRETFGNAMHIVNHTRSPQPAEKQGWLTPRRPAFGAALHAQVPQPRKLPLQEHCFSRASWSFEQHRPSGVESPVEHRHESARYVIRLLQRLITYQFTLWIQEFPIVSLPQLKTLVARKAELNALAFLTTSFAVRP